MRPGKSHIARRGPRARTVLLVLAMLALRSPVPAGYMLASSDGAMGVVLCDTAAAASAHHHHAGHEHPDRAHAHPDPTCPYAQSAGPAPLPALPVLAAEPVADRTLLPQDSSQTLAAFGPLRQHPPRGPPLLA